MTFSKKAEARFLHLPKRVKKEIEQVNPSLKITLRLFLRSASVILTSGKYGDGDPNYVKKKKLLFRGLKQVVKFIAPNEPKLRNKPKRATKFALYMKRVLIIMTVGLKDSLREEDERQARPTVSLICTHFLNIVLLSTLKTSMLPTQLATQLYAFLKSVFPSSDREHLLNSVICSNVFDDAAAGKSIGFHLLTAIVQDQYLYLSPTATTSLFKKYLAILAFFYQNGSKKGSKLVMECLETVGKQGMVLLNDTEEDIFKKTGVKLKGKAVTWTNILSKMKLRRIANEVRTEQTIVSTKVGKGIPTVPMPTPSQNQKPPSVETSSFCLDCTGDLDSSSIIGDLGSDEVDSIFTKPTSTLFGADDLLSSMDFWGNLKNPLPLGMEGKAKDKSNPWRFNDSTDTLPIFGNGSFTFQEENGETETRKESDSEEGLKTPKEDELDEELTDEELTKESDSEEESKTPKEDELDEELTDEELTKESDSEEESKTPKEDELDEELTDEELTKAEDKIKNEPKTPEKESKLNSSLSADSDDDDIEVIFEDVPKRLSVIQSAPYSVEKTEAEPSHKYPSYPNQMLSIYQADEDDRDEASSESGESVVPDYTKEEKEELEEEHENLPDLLQLEATSTKKTETDEENRGSLSLLNTGDSDSDETVIFSPETYKKPAAAKPEFASFSKEEISKGLETAVPGHQICEFLENLTPIKIPPRPPSSVNKNKKSGFEDKSPLENAKIPIQAEKGEEESRPGSIISSLRSRASRSPASVTTVTSVKSTPTRGRSGRRLTLPALSTISSSESPASTTSGRQRRFTTKDSGVVSSPSPSPARLTRSRANKAPLALSLDPIPEKEDTPKSPSPKKRPRMETIKALKEKEEESMDMELDGSQLSMSQVSKSPAGRGRSRGRGRVQGKYVIPSPSRIVTRSSTKNQQTEGDNSRKMSKKFEDS